MRNQRNSYREWGWPSDPISGSMSDAQVSGSVKWFNKDKGYGFITVSGRAKDIFFHAKEWNAAALNTLPVEGEQLVFTVTPGPKGEYATNILRTGAPNAARIGEPT